MMEAELVTLPLSTAPDAELERQSSTAPPSIEPEDPLTREKFLAGMQRRVGIVAGVALVITTGTIAKVVEHAPEYEGKFQLTAERIAPAGSAVASPQIQDVNQAIAVPGLTGETEIKVLQSPRFIDPIVKQLQAEDPKLDYSSLSRKLKIKIGANQNLEVRYRDTDPKRVQFVLDKLAQSYVSYSQECQESACQGIKFIEVQVPKIQQRITTLREETRQFYQQHGLQNQEAQIQLFSTRAVAIAKQQAEVEGRLAEARRQYTELQQRMALQPNEAIALTLLNQDSRYQELLLQLQKTDSQIATELSRLNADNSTLQTLYGQYQTLQAQLSQEAQQVLPRYLAKPTANLQDPVFQNPTYLQLLQQSINTVYYIQILQVRQQTTVQAEQLITQQRSQVATLLRQYAGLQQKLQVEIETLQYYVDRLQVLKAQSPEQLASWKLVASPELIQNNQGEPAPVFRNLRHDVSTGAIFGVLLGLGVAAALEQSNETIRRRTSPA
jgi:succinoglycan biosynthesis transport protein ExoP